MSASASASEDAARRVAAVCPTSCLLYSVSRLLLELHFCNVGVSLVRG